MVSSFVLEASGKVSLGHVKPNATARGAVKRVAETRDPQSPWWARGKRLQLKSTSTVFFLGAPLALLALLHLLTVAASQFAKEKDAKAALQKPIQPVVGEKEIGVTQLTRKRKTKKGKAKQVDVSLPALTRSQAKENFAPSATGIAAEGHLTLAEQEDVEALEIELSMGMITPEEYAEALGKGHNSCDTEQSASTMKESNEASVCLKQDTTTVCKVVSVSTKDYPSKVAKEATGDM
jgi:hypothetical protein